MNETLLIISWLLILVFGILPRFIEIVKNKKKDKDYTKW